MNPTTTDTGFVKDGKVVFPYMRFGETEGPQPTPNPQAPADRIGYAIVGLGRLSVQEIIPALAQCSHSKLVALVSGTPEKAALVAKEHGVKKENVYSYEQFDKIKDNPEIQAVYIVLPNALHKEYTLRAAAAGKHVLCEKPMAMNPQEAQEMIDACKKANVKLMIAYRMQYEPYTLEVIKRLRKGDDIGKVKALVITNYQNQGHNDQWRFRLAPAGGGSLPDIGIYCFNAARYLTGEEPIEVSNAMLYSTPGDVRFKEVEESAYWTFKFPSGIIAQMSCSYGAHQTKACQIVGEKGRIIMDPAFTYAGINVKIEKSSEFEQSLELSTVEDDQFGTEMDHFALCIKKNKEPRTTGAEGLQDHVIMEAIYKAAREGKSVPLPKHEGLDVFRGTKPEDLE